MKKKNENPESLTDELNVEATAASAGRYARKLLDESSLVTSAEGLTAAICEKPIQSAFIALGIGALLGILIRR